MTALDRLRELDTAASPGPWTHASVMVETENTEIRLASEYDAQLAALAHLLLPAIEALEAIRTHEHDEVAYDEFAYHRMVEAYRNAARAVLARLEEALK